jgi:sugar phosphate isomerase/epimerase
MSYGVDSDLILSIMTLRKTNLPDRIQAAHKAGFQGIGWRLDDFTEALRAGLDEEAIARLLVSSEISLSEVEFFREWVNHEGELVYQEKERKLFELAVRFGARHINTAIFEPRSKAEIAHSLTALCRRAARSNLIVQLEFMPYTPPVHSLQDAWDIIQAVDEPNVGLLIDAWHWVRARESANILAKIPPNRITSVQLGDTLATPLSEITEESRHYRCIPGTGAFDLTTFLQMLEAYGITAPLSIEVMSDELDAMPPPLAAQKVAQSTKEVLQQFENSSKQHRPKVKSTAKASC